jgi:hypothetical protein
MGDTIAEQAATVTKADFNVLVAQMAAMMDQIKTNNGKLVALSSGATSTGPPKPNDDMDKGDPP